MVGMSVPYIINDDRGLKMSKVFTKCIKTRGDLYASFVFEDQKAVDKWVGNELTELDKKYKNLEVQMYDLPGLKVGDQCNVYGEGDEVFTIVGLRESTRHAHSFLLDSGCYEEVAKCHREFV